MQALHVSIAHIAAPTQTQRLQLPQACTKHTCNNNMPGVLHYSTFGSTFGLFLHATYMLNLAGYTS